MPVYIFVDPVGVRRYGRRHGGESAGKGRALGFM
jgi:hypothetical protein